MRVRFWGVRGSVPWAARQAIGYGCNTPCVELVDEATDERLVLDAGSGIVGLGEALAGSERPIPILLTHYHWDHVQGLPFFAPLYRRGRVPALWAPLVGSYDPAWAQKIFQSPFFPVPFEGLPGPPAVRTIGCGACTIGRFDIRAFNLNHPGGAFAYRIVGSTGDLVYATDHELGDAAVDDALREFIRGAGAVIFDAHFTPAEAAASRGRGHSTWHAATEFCASAGVGHAWLFHHKPGRSDAELAEIQANARRILERTTAAREGDVFEV